MATNKSTRKSTRDTGRDDDAAEIDTSAAANDDGDPTGQSGPVAGTGADSVVHANKQGGKLPSAQKADDKAKTKELYLDQPYLLHGKSYPASQHPGDLVSVPEDFPEHILPNKGEAPSSEEWAQQVRSTPQSNVVDITDESNKAL